MSRKNSNWRTQNERPEGVNGQLAVRTEFYKRELTRIVKGMFEVEFPDEWNDDYFLDIILFYGYVCITDTAVGVVPLRSTLKGINYNDFPTSVLSTLPILGNIERTLGVDAQITYFEWNYRTRTFYTFDEIIRIFSQRLASCDCGVDVNIMNSRLAYIAEAETRAQADTIKYMIDRITDGEPLVVYRANSLTAQPLNLVFNNLRQNFITPELLDAKRSIMNEFLTLLGVNNANTDKKERLITSEVDANDEELAVNIGEFKRNLEKGCRLTKKLYPSLKYDIRFKFDSESREEVRKKSDDLLRSSSSMERTSSNR